jgi:hypothetical protein
MVTLCAITFKVEEIQHSAHRVYSCKHIHTLWSSGTAVTVLQAERPRVLIPVTARHFFFFSKTIRTGSVASYSTGSGFLSWGAEVNN